MLLAKEINVLFLWLRVFRLGRECWQSYEVKIMVNCECIVLGFRVKVKLPLSQHPLFVWIKQLGPLNLSFPCYWTLSLYCIFRHKVLSLLWRICWSGLSLEASSTECSFSSVFQTWDNMIWFPGNIGQSVDSPILKHVYHMFLLDNIITKISPLSTTPAKAKDYQCNKTEPNPKRLCQKTLLVMSQYRRWWEQRLASDCKKYF